MFICYVCLNELPRITVLRAHLHTHLQLGELVYPVKCCQDGCKSSFGKLYNFIRHLSTYHTDDEHHGTTNVPDGSDNDNHPCAGSDHTSSLQPVHRERDRSHVASVQSEGVAMVAALRANSSIPYGQCYNEIGDLKISIAKIAIMRSRLVIGQLGCSNNPLCMISG